MIGEFVVERRPDEMDPERLAEALLKSDAPGLSPEGRVLVAEVTRSNADALAHVPVILRERRADVRPVLVAIPHHQTALRTVAAAFDTTVVIDRDHQSQLPSLFPYFPALFRNWAELGSLGTVRKFQLELGDAALSPWEVETELAVRNGRSFHEFGTRRTPDLFAITAPEEWQSETESVLSERAPVETCEQSHGNHITVVSFVFTSVDEWLRASSPSGGVGVSEDVPQMDGEYANQQDEAD
jgi:hypothetical protein